VVCATHNRDHLTIEQSWPIGQKAGIAIIVAAIDTAVEPV
jgi:hypothetical protein